MNLRTHERRVKTASLWPSPDQPVKIRRMRPKCCPILIPALLGCLCATAVSCQETRPDRGLGSDAKMRRGSLAQPGLVKSEFIFESAPFPECHASTIAETESGLVAAWFGGTHERHPDVGIWISRLVNGKWTPPIEIANGIQSPTNRYPCWNPVLFQPKNGPLLLFYKVGPSPSQWWGMMMEVPDLQSALAGQSPKPRRLPEGILGPIKNKPVQLPTGDILCPSSTEDKGWRVHFEWTSDLGKTWHKTEPVNDGKTIGAIQPTILFLSDGKLQALGRTKQGKIFEIWSNDRGKTWSEMRLASLPNPNSGIDAVTLRDGRQLMVYNHSTKGRSPLNVAVSPDGKVWQSALMLEDEPGKQFSYPAVIQTKDGLVHITYTWKRERIKHAVLDPLKLKLEPLAD
jgi:Predicted neuraminidase (sialidase)